MQGAAIDRILGEIVHSKAIATPIDYVLCIGHFLGKDEDVYTFFEPELPSDIGIPRSKVSDAPKVHGERRSVPKLPSSRASSKSSQNRNRPVSNSEKKTSNGRRPSPENVSWNVLDLKKENYFSCAVGRTRTNARYLLSTPDDVVAFLRELSGTSISNGPS